MFSKWTMQVKPYSPWFTFLKDFWNRKEVWDFNEILMKSLNITIWIKLYYPRYSFFHKLFKTKRYVGFRWTFKEDHWKGNMGQTVMSYIWFFIELFNTKNYMILGGNFYKITRWIKPYCSSYYFSNKLLNAKTYLTLS